MKKKRMRIAAGAAAAVLALSLLFLWPLPFSNIIKDDANLSILLMAPVITTDPEGYIKSDIISTQYSFSPGAEAFEQIQQILGEYSFHRCLRTYFSSASLNGKKGTDRWLHLYAGQKSVITGGSGEILVSSRIYRVYGGKKAALLMTEEIRGVLANNAAGVIS